MTVKELMKVLQNMDENAEVRIPDTYWQNEGYGECADDFNSCYPKVDGVRVDGNSVIICSEDCD